MKAKSKKIHRIHFAKEKETLLITLYGKALDSRSKKSILNDKKADQIVKSIDYDFEGVKNLGGIFTVVRARQLDDWLREFLKWHRNSTILNLGCGLDTRVSRIKPTSTVKWFDVDYPEVIKLRKNFYSNTKNYKMIGSSFTKSRWLEDIPNDGKVMIIAEGTLEYIKGKEVKILLNRLTKHFEHGNIGFDVLSSLAVNFGKSRLKKSMGAVHKWSVDDLSEINRMDRKLKLVRSLSISDSKYISKLPIEYAKTYAKNFSSPKFNNMMRLVLYRF